MTRFFLGLAPLFSAGFSPEVVVPCCAFGPSEPLAFLRNLAFSRFARAAC